MARRTLILTEEQRHKLLQLRDHDARPYVRERGAALLKVADGDPPHRVAKARAAEAPRPRHPLLLARPVPSSGVQWLLAHPQGDFPREAFFSDAEPILERLRQGPGEEARQEMATTDTCPPPSRWTLRTIGRTIGSPSGA